MNYKFLDKVLDQIVSETRIDFNISQDNWISIFTPMANYPIFSSQPTENPFKRVFHYPMFKRHCKEVYGLNDIETEHLFSSYNRVISDKVNNG